MFCYSPHHIQMGVSSVLQINIRYYSGHLRSNTRLTANLTESRAYACSIAQQFDDVINIADLLGFFRRVPRKPTCWKIPFALSFLQRIQYSTFVAVSFENQFDRLFSYLVTASEEYDEEEYEDNENGRFRSSFICSRNVFSCLQGQFTAWVINI